MLNVNKFQVPGKSKVVQGSILNPHNAGLCFVLSVNNLEGKPEGNPLLPLFDKKWKQVRSESRGWYTGRTGAYKVGAVNTIATQSNVWVIQMLCQDSDLKIDITGLKQCLKETIKLANSEKATIHVSSILITAIPELTDLLKSEVITAGVSVYVYDEVV